MKAFYIRETVACFVTFTKRIEAENEKAALDLWREGGGDDEGAAEIGDTIDYVPQEIEIQLAE